MTHSRRGDVGTVTAPLATQYTRKRGTEWLMHLVSHRPFGNQTPTPFSPNGETMTLIKLIAALGKVKKPDEIDNASLRYVDTMGHTQTVPIAEVIEEIPHGEDGVRRVILVGQI